MDIVFFIDKEKNRYLILTAEQKSQGTNNRIFQEKGEKGKQRILIQRLGNNLISLRT